MGQDKGSCFLLGAPLSPSSFICLQAPSVLAFRQRGVQSMTRKKPDRTQFEKQVEKIWEFAAKSEERLQDIEIHINLLTRLLTTLCVEKFGMRVGVLKRLIKRVEKEAIRDSQILQLESLYQMPTRPSKHHKGPSPPGKGGLDDKDSKST